MPDFVIAPGFTAFAALYQSRRPVLLSTSLVADLETPVSAMLKLAGSEPYSFLLESVEGGATLGRYSFIGLAPDLIWRCERGVASLNRTALENPDGPFISLPDKPFSSLQSLLDESRIEAIDKTLPPMAAGLFGYLGYDMVREIEKLPDTRPDTLQLPDSILSRPTIIAVFDNIQHTLTIITPVWPGAVAVDVAYAEATARLSNILEKLQQPVPGALLSSPQTAESAVPVSNTSQAGYEHMVESAKEYIAAGDIFQVVPSHRFALPFDKPALSFYRALRRLNPSPFLFLLNFPDFAIAGSSPEILVRVRDKKVTIRPLAGTRQRGKDAEEDERLATELLADEKELAEHLMLLDLGRNDVGRVAKPGTVKVTEKMVIERYSHVMHISSTVEGELREGLTVLDALQAGFPAGTVSGAPKVRAMEIIDELEVARRGVYGGCIGYFGANGDMDTCIALRTAVLKEGMIYVQAGAGVVADSDPASEYAETYNKAGALLKAASEASR
jgi:anthranilate synthase component 1